MESTQARKYEARLLELRQAITSLDTARQAGSAVVELDQSRTGRLSRMDALQGQAMAQAGRTRAATELLRIDAALGRLRDGTFGICIGCTEPIAEARLAAHPAVSLCLACAEAREKR